MTVQAPNSAFVMFIPDIYMMSGILDDETENLRTTFDFIWFYSNDSGCRAVFATVDEQTTRVSVDKV